MPGDPREEITRYLPALRAFALSLTHDPNLADEVVQETVIKAWINFGSFENGTNLKAWLFTILRNTFYSELRRRRPELVELDDLHEQNIGMRPYQEDMLVLRDFMNSFRTLSLEQREALLLIGALGFTYEEAADMCAVPIGTMKSRVNRGRSALATHLRDC